MPRKLTPYDLALWAALPMAHTPRIEGRLTMILDTTRSRRALTRRILIIPLGIGTAALVPLAMLQPVARAQTASVAPPKSRELERNNPDAAVRHLRQIYTYVGVYRQTHKGLFPATVGPNSLAADMATHPQVYGLPDQGGGNSAQVMRVFTSPDNLFTAYFLHSKRPDGTLVGTAKEAGTRDVFAYTNLYIHNSVHGERDRGFYLVLWADGEVQKIEAKRALIVPAYDVISDQPGETEQVRREGGRQIAFSGQAGLPKG